MKLPHSQAYPLPSSCGQKLDGERAENVLQVITNWMVRAQTGWWESWECSASYHKLDGERAENVLQEMVRGLRMYCTEDW